MAPAGSINVAVRVRPPSAWEAARMPDPIYETTIRSDGILSAPVKSASSVSCVREIVQVVDDRILTFDPAETDQARAFVERGFLPPGSKRYKDRRFMFDRVFRHDASQQDVYDATARPLLNRLLDGFNATVFAYGATGCGKTHTISGTESDPGIIYLTMADLFQRIEDRKDEYSVEVVVTFLEIYNEEIRDLLAESGPPVPRGGLQIREDKTVKVVGLAERRPQTADEVKEIVLLGNSRRTQSPTHANETSSRSHAVLQVHVTQAPRTASLTEERTMGTLSIIDLAGSERAAATTNMGQRMVEGANINKSLLALGNCINALCESGGSVRHVPYRNSKLTRLLKFSLGGNCQTVMVVCVAPTSLHFDDTHNTLIYAERATKIKTRVVTRNVVNVDRHVGQYVEAINRLNLEVAELKAKLAGKLGVEAEIVRRKKTEAQAEVERVKKDLQVKQLNTQTYILDGATCSGQLSVAQIKLRTVHTRLNELDQLQTSSPSGLQDTVLAERALLQALAAPDEQAVRMDSALNNKIRHADSHRQLFDGVLRAVTERRNGRLDDVSMENVRLDVQSRRAELEKYKAEAERSVVKDAMEDQTRMLVQLLGVVGRYTVVLKNASHTLLDALETGRESLEGTARVVQTSLEKLVRENDQTFQSMVNHSISTYAALSTSKTNLESFIGQSRANRVSSAPIAASQAKIGASRRSSYGVLGLGSPARKIHSLRSPRKSLRNSFGGAPYRRPSDKGKDKKGVQWKDEAGQGTLDDGGRAPSSSVGPRPSTSAVATDDNVFSPRIATPADSDWEDEKTDDSSAYHLDDIPRPRPSRIGSSFRGRGASALASLNEVDESQADSPRRRGVLLSSRSLNADTDLGDSGKLKMPKGAQERQNMPSPRRQGAPPIPRAVAHTKGGRRKSNIGPLRNERVGRRRSSLIPQLSPRHNLDEDVSSSAPLNRSMSHAPRRIAVLEGPKSPAKRAKRMSLLSLASKSLAATRLRAANTSLANASGDMSGGESSFRAKPTWK
ncbi:kinesin-domain-containing protein [Vararia minispora EC-137]|uniref:Kinesin-domain-containing protein n=1 Tax=Vararia minispora EC-137 TaxID=1314806 RepID=A0ACB8QVH0_9AGAM|nr:kinesin-domain-containing protein [Vararia minispora EC-137]